MTVPKLSPSQWFRLVLTLLPFIRGLVKQTGLGVVAVIRTVIDLVAEVESLYPPELDADGKPRKRGVEKAAAFLELITAGFATADDALGQLPTHLAPIAQAGAAVVALFNSWGIFKTAGSSHA